MQLASDGVVLSRTDKVDPEFIINIVSKVTALIPTNELKDNQPTLEVGSIEDISDRLEELLIDDERGHLADHDRGYNYEYWLFKEFRFTSSLSVYSRLFGGEGTGSVFYGWQVTRIGEDTYSLTELEINE